MYIGNMVHYLWLFAIVSIFNVDIRQEVVNEGHVFDLNKSKISKNYFYVFCMYNLGYIK